MAFNIVTFSASLKNLLSKNNTTTSSYDISNSLKVRINKITTGYHTGKPMLTIDYPCIWIEPTSKSNEFSEIGNSANRNMSLDYDIVAITNEGLGYSNGREVADNEMLQLESNLENLFRNYPRLSITSQVQSSLITSVNFDVSESNETYNSMAKLRLTINIKSN